MKAFIPLPFGHRNSIIYRSQFVFAYSIFNRILWIFINIGQFAVEYEIIVTHCINIKIWDKCIFTLEIRAYREIPVIKFIGVILWNRHYFNKIAWLYYFTVIELYHSVKADIVISTILWLQFKFIISHMDYIISIIYPRNWWQLQRMILCQCHFLIHYLCGCFVCKYPFQQNKHQKNKWCNNNC